MRGWRASPTLHRHSVRPQNCLPPYIPIRHCRRWLAAFRHAWHLETSPRSSAPFSLSVAGPLRQPTRHIPAGNRSDRSSLQRVFLIVQNNKTIITFLPIAAAVMPSVATWCSLSYVALWAKMTNFGSAGIPLLPYAGFHAVGVVLIATSTPSVVIGRSCISLSSTTYRSEFFLT